MLVSEGTEVLSVSDVFWAWVLPLWGAMFRWSEGRRFFISPTKPKMMNEVWTDEWTWNLNFWTNAHFSLYHPMFLKLLFNKYVYIFWVCFDHFSLFKYQPDILFNCCSVLPSSVKWHTRTEEAQAPLKKTLLVWVWLCIWCKNFCSRTPENGIQVLLTFLGDSRL